MLLLYKFRYRDPIRNKVVTSRHRLTRADIEQQYPGAEVLEDTAIMLSDQDNPAVQWGEFCGALQRAGESRP